MSILDDALAVAKLHQKIDALTEIAREVASLSVAGMWPGSRAVADAALSFFSEPNALGVTMADRAEALSQWEVGDRPPTREAVETVATRIARERGTIDTNLQPQLKCRQCGVRTSITINGYCPKCDPEKTCGTMATLPRPDDGMGEGDVDGGGAFNAE